MTDAERYQWIKRQKSLVLSTEGVKWIHETGEGERIVFMGHSDEAGQPIYVDNLRRKKLITHIRSTYEKRIDGTGRLATVSRKSEEQGMIAVRTDSHGILNIPIEPERVKEFDGHIDEIVQFDIQVTLDSSDAVVSVLDAHDLGLVFDVSTGKALTQIDSLSELEDGWADGHGRQISETAISVAKDIARSTPGLAELYRIFPREDGGILFDFEVNGWDLSIEVSSSGLLELYGIGVDGSQAIEPISFIGVNGEFLEKLANLSGANNV